MSSPRYFPPFNLFFEHCSEDLLFSIIFIFFLLNWNRKLSLNYLQLNASGVKSYKDDGSRRRNSKKRGSDMSYDSSDITSGQPPLSKNDINNIRRSQVWAALHQFSDIYLSVCSSEFNLYRFVIYSLYLSDLKIS